jgi:hypothetical protein
MARDYVCPRCGESEELRGRTAEDGIVLVCESCGHEWPRDEVARCATCDGTDLQRVPRALTAAGRGNVTSIVGKQMVPVCAQCDRDMIERYINRGHALPPGHITAAASKRG